MKQTLPWFLIIVSLSAVCAFAVYHLDNPVGSFTPISIGIFPDHTLTPGVTNPNVTQSSIKSTICVKGWTATIRPASSYTTALKTTQMKSWNLTGPTSAYEEDHLISLELGGNPTDPKNLWPESYLTTPNAKDKDRTENYLKAEICAGRLTLKEAQKEISTNWVAVYNKISGNLGSINTTDFDDETN